MFDPGASAYGVAVVVRHLEISHEWGTYAVRDLVTGDRVDPAGLPLPGSVVDRLDRWAARWDTTFDLDTPGRSKVDEWVLAELGRDGARLWRAVLSLLPPQEYTVVYRYRAQVYRTPDELPDEWRLA